MMTEVMIVWLVLLIVAIVAEVLTMGLTTIWFAGGALVAIFAAILNAPVWLQIVLFFAVSLVLLIFTRPIAVKYFNKDRVKTNAESLVGRQAIVTGEIDNLQGIGQVTVGSQEWSARSNDNKVRIPVGAVVDVLAINGVKLIVRPNVQMTEMGFEKNSVPEPMSVSQMEEMESPRV
ncbi:MAG: NfeD family protein [Acetatifactor sp.]